MQDHCDGGILLSSAQRLTLPPLQSRMIFRERRQFPKSTSLGFRQLPVCTAVEKLSFYSRITSSIQHGFMAQIVIYTNGIVIKRQVDETTTERERLRGPFTKVGNPRQRIEMNYSVHPVSPREGGYGNGSQCLLYRFVKFHPYAVV